MGVRFSSVFRKKSAFFFVAGVNDHKPYNTSSDSIKPAPNKNLKRVKDPV